jgi:two-component system, LytTR family, sensor kinase
MKKSIIISLHVLYWIPRFVILILTLVGFWMSPPRNHVTFFNSAFYLQLANLIPSFICFYVFYIYLFPHFLAKKRISLFIILGLVVWIILSLLSLVLINNLSLEQISNKAPIYYWLWYIAPSILFSGIVGSLFKGFISWYSEIRIKEQLVQKNLQSELALLKAQINPHFLFNTINNIDILIEKDPNKASKYLKQLSEIMRFMLYETSSDFIPLSTELEYITKYIELQKIRTANEKYVNFTINGENKEKMIAPTILIPFIENAFKHSTNKKIEDTINITVIITENDISFICINYFDDSKKFIQEKSGLGIELIKQRLNLLYKDRYELSIDKTDTRFEVKLKINT